MKMPANYLTRFYCIPFRNAMLASTSAYVFLRVSHSTIAQRVPAFIAVAKMAFQSFASPSPPMESPPPGFA